MNGLEKLRAYTELHFVGETEIEIILSDRLMQLFNLPRIVQKEEANRYLGSLTQEPMYYPTTLDFLDITIELVNGTALKVPL